MTDREAIGYLLLASYKWKTYSPEGTMHRIV